MGISVILNTYRDKYEYLREKIKKKKKQNQSDATFEIDSFSLQWIEIVGPNDHIEIIEH